MSDAKEEVPYLPEGKEEELRNQHGPIAVIRLEGLETYVFHRMSQAVNDQLMEAAEDSSKRMAAIRQAVLYCQCYPLDAKGEVDFDAARAMFAACPDAPAEIMVQIKDLAPKLDIKKR